MSTTQYRGRLAPSPTGFLHLGHARTFFTAAQRAAGAGGVLVLRSEDLDSARSKAEFAQAMIQDLRWMGLSWQEGPDCGGPFGPYLQSQRSGFYQATFEKLLSGGWIYPCRCSRKDVLRSVQAPHAGDEEPIYPGTCRGKQGVRQAGPAHTDANLQKSNWRFRVPDGETICFLDGCVGPQRFVAGKDFGDFVVWRQDGVPSYQLAVVVDDAAMRITEVVRGSDLLLSTARQLLLYRALNLPIPTFFHCPLVTDSSGVRLAKRHDALSLRALKAQGVTPKDLPGLWNPPV